MFQQSVILYTLGMAHFVEYSSVEEIPDPLNMKKDEKPVGALILALQAVEYALKRWETGTYNKASNTADYFSFDNYGDVTEKRIQLTGTTKKLVSHFNPRATKFMQTAQGLKDEQWSHIFENATDFLVRSKKKRRGCTSGSSATTVVEADEDDESEQAVDSFTFASDDGPFGAD
ncbi:hypothetical protein D9619_011528 [Psilocybe cf. subviscida]|uniref:Uncharacterized protein n=1 Tax=Psilocybe cf. subviscida TaxID=2480587 RepID=A0A8H5F9U7_9AGAR|nr:hypothetical protein D9619_011528 [Psilocybe cf. subviscida]